MGGNPVYCCVGPGEIALGSNKLREIKPCRDIPAVVALTTSGLSSTVYGEVAVMQILIAAKHFQFVLRH